MKDPVLITEVLSRSEQGTTRPFLCRGEDGQLYYVKGRYAGLRSLCCEWVGGRLAEKLGLRTPQITMVEVPEKLIECSARPDIKDLGEGLAFGSARVEAAQEISWESLQYIPWHNQALILFFDWWVQNEDRTLSACGGNPNLLITAGPPDEEIWLEQAEQMPSIIWTFDFNLAFDPPFHKGRFWDGHIFAAARRHWSADFMAETTRRVELIMKDFLFLFASLPEAWLYIDGDDNLPMQLDLDVVLRTLRRPLDQPAEFWSNHER
ncbi:MAG: HipA family kinase [Verrucomicrobiota bacterium]